MSSWDGQFASWKQMFFSGKKSCPVKFVYKMATFGHFVCF